MKGIYVRLFVVADTEEGLQKRVKEIKDKSSAYKMTVLAGNWTLNTSLPLYCHQHKIDGKSTSANCHSDLMI